MSIQLELVQAYAKALSTRDFDALKVILHPTTFAFTITPKSLGFPTIEGVTQFIGAAQGMLGPPQEIIMRINEDEVMEEPGRIWAVTMFSGKNALGELFSEELIFRGRTAKHEGKLVFTEVKETVDPKEEDIIMKKKD